MLIGGFQKLTLIDYPGKIATTVFTVGCNFRCPFCHNPELVMGALSPSANFTEEEFFLFLDHRKEKLEGVCITGGEPTIQPDLIDFALKIKDKGFLVKLDTNGSRPDILKKMIDERMVDYIAMDIKNAPKKYAFTSRVKNLDIERIKLSADLIRNSHLEYEFRTTVVPGMHKPEDFHEIGKWLKGSRRYYLQRFRNTGVLDRKFAEKTASQKIDLEAIKDLMLKYFQEVRIRE